MLSYGIKAIQPGSADNLPHVFGFQTARTTAGDTLLELWNGSTNAAKKFAVDLDGNLATVKGGTFTGAVTVESTTGPQLRVGYDSSNHLDVTVNSGGDATVTPSGGDVTVAGTLKVTGAAMTYDGVANARNTFTTTTNITVSGLDNLTGSAWHYAVVELTCVGGTPVAATPFVSKYLVRLQGLSSWTVGTSTNIGGGSLTIALVSGTASSVTFSVTAPADTVCSISVTAHGQSNSPAIAFS